MRGLVNQLANVPSSVVDGSRQLVTMSAGNYGRAFAQALNERKLKGVVCMPENAPENRAQLIKVGFTGYMCCPEVSACVRVAEEIPTGIWKILTQKRVEKFTHFLLVDEGTVEPR